jgi:hypothetical protein
VANFGPDIPVHRFTVNDLRRMRDVGIVAPRARVELLAGLLIDMHRPAARETTAKRRLVDALARCFGADVVRGEPGHREGHATFDATIMVHDWERLPLTAPFPLHRFSVAEFDRMLKIGILPYAGRYDVLDGVVFDVDGRPELAKNHAAAVAARLRSLASDALIRVGPAVGLGPYSRVRLDVAACRPRADAYRSSLPTGEDLLLAIDLTAEPPEVTQLLRWPVYARWRVPTAWIVDLHRREVRVGRRTSPTSGLAVNVYRGDDVIRVSTDAGGIRACDLVGRD